MVPSDLASKFHVRKFSTVSLFGWRWNSGHNSRSYFDWAETIPWWAWWSSNEEAPCIRFGRYFFGYLLKSRLRFQCKLKWACGIILFNVFVYSSWRMHKLFIMIFDLRKFSTFASLVLMAWPQLGYIFSYFSPHFPIWHEISTLLFPMCWSPRRAPGGSLQLVSRSGGGFAACSGVSPHLLLGVPQVEHHLLCFHRGHNCGEETVL